MYNANELYNERIRKMQDFDKRAEYYFNAGDKSLALANYINALKELTELTALVDVHVKLGNKIKGIGDSNTVHHSESDKIVFSLGLAARLLKIWGCETGDNITDKLIKVYTTKKIDDILEKVAASISRISFDKPAVDNSFIVLVSFIESQKNFIYENQSTATSINSIIPSDEKNKFLKDLREALASVDLSDKCVLKLEQKEEPLYKVKESSNSNCFIATAAYSTSIHPDLDTFRSFRDEKLLPHPLGAKLVSLYYKISPSLARYIAQQPTIKKLLKHYLSHLAHWIRLSNN